MSRTLVAILLIASVLCKEDYVEKYVSPCPGAISGNSTYNTFLVESFKKEGNLMMNCTLEYFKNVTAIGNSGCNEKHKECVVSLMLLQ